MESQDNVAVSVTLAPDLLARVDARAAELDLNRSQYFRRLARLDLASQPASAPELPKNATATEPVPA